MKSESWLEVLRPASDSLNKRQFLLLQLVYRHGLTQESIARRLDVPLGSVSAAITSAMRTLSVELERPRLNLLAPVVDVA